jgi:tetratricopeptide (TPR) repeat protein
MLSAKIAVKKKYWLSSLPLSHRGRYLPIGSQAIQPWLNIVAGTYLGFVGILIACPIRMSGQSNSRQDISPFGVVGMAPGETLNFKATGRPGGQGCNARLAFERTSGGVEGRSLSVNLAPGLSATVQHVAQQGPHGRHAVRPVAWVDPAFGPGDCDLSLELGDPSDSAVRQLRPPAKCETTNCLGVSAASLNYLRLRLYVVAAGRQVCHAEMGFRLSDGGASSTSKYVPLPPGHAEWLDWRPDNEVTDTASVVPVAVFHQGDFCIASAEVFADENEPAKAEVQIQSYESSVIGLAQDPNSLSKTIQTLQHELQTNPNDLWAINALAQAYDRADDKSTAINLLTQALAINPHASDSWLLLAQFFYQRGNYNSAVESLRRCLNIDPNNIVGRAALADSLANLQRFEEGKEVFAVLLDSPGTRTPFVLTSYADFLYNQERFPEALHYVTESDLRHPHCENTLLIKARILFALKRLPEATQAAEEVVRIDHEARLARLLLAKLYFVQGRTREARGQTAWLKEDDLKHRPR